MATIPTSTGEIPFDAPGAGKPTKTWYKVVGSLDSPSPPLITLHGGPGSGHNYLSPFIDLYERHEIPIIFYDQIGCGNSTHFREKMGDTTFWNFDLFFAELDNLIDHFKLREKGFFLFGQSWGGMLAGAYASRAPSPAGLKKVIIGSGPASIPLFIQGCNELLAQLPDDVREALAECDRKGDYESPEFEAAAGVFYRRHLCRLDEYPEEILEGLKNLSSDKTSYLTLQGPTEWTITGSIKDWEGWKDAHKIRVDTLVINGRYDEMTDLCVAPWFKCIPRVRWITLENASHMGHWEQRERYMEVVGGFLTG